MSGQNLDRRTSSQPTSFAARQAALGICADLAKDIVTGLTDDSEWRLNVLDELGKPVFRIRLLVESLGPTIAGSVAQH